ncbi:uncharacterized protein LOC113237082 [Hyposmocoma kahamanoa]|uniref:uncharacterized protein LOC113237082 n=1 Tax=Hyposmocoma kahamanoa TaxID=1477025 RepID=UPI000E6D9181|nr:uncharacterized protein LOC113237082 [Hyposmocoma kahamanoa]
MHDLLKHEGHFAKVAISAVKTSGRQQILESLDRDPWGRPYRAARNKLHAQAPPLTETLQPQLLEGVVSALFPDRPDHVPPTMAGSHSEVEAEEEVPPIESVEGRFPICWEERGLVLLKKDGRPAESPAAYRPIVLLDDVGKRFERIVASLIVRHFHSVGPDLSDHQFGFRERRSTVDAIMRVKAFSDETVASGGVLLAVSLDIANAFNTLPFWCISEALRYHRVPHYLKRIIGVYLSDRPILYLGQYGVIRRRIMRCVVPQGSILGCSCGISDMIGSCGAPFLPGSRCSATRTIPWSQPEGRTLRWQRHVLQREFGRSLGGSKCWA